MADLAVAEKKSTAVASFMDDAFKNAGQGLEDIGLEDMQIPFMRIVQPLSPQLMKKDIKFIDGISAGDIFNNVTGDFLGSRRGCCCYTVCLPNEVS